MAGTMALSEIWRSIATHGLTGAVGVGLWHAWDARPVPQPAEKEMSVVKEDHRQAVSRRARELADEAAGSFDRARAESSNWISKTPREQAEDALARRDEILAEWQGKVDALKRAAEKFRGDGRLMEKIEDRLFRGEDEELAAMVLALVLQDEDRALQELGRRTALNWDHIIDPAFEALPESTLERWAVEREMPGSLRYTLLRVLGRRLGRRSDLDGVARAWAKIWPDGADVNGRSFLDDFVGEWICPDPEAAVRRVFHEWPEDLRLRFIEQMRGFNVSRPIWTTGLSAAMREALWETVPEGLREEVMNEIEEADDRLESLSLSSLFEASREPLKVGMTPEDARKEISSRVERLLEQGPDLLDQLADGRIEVEDIAQNLATRIPGIAEYPEALVEAVFEETSATDAVGALRYAEEKIGPQRLESPSARAMRSMMVYEERLDRVFGAAALLPSVEGEHGDLTDGFLKWQAFAPRQADECLRGLPASGPLRQAIEAKLAGKEAE
jgi:hypothetical protein